MTTADADRARVKHKAERRKQKALRRLGARGERAVYRCGAVRSVNTVGRPFCFPLSVFCFTPGCLAPGGSGLILVGSSPNFRSISDTRVVGLMPIRLPQTVDGDIEVPEAHLPVSRRQGMARSSCRDRSRWRCRMPPWRNRGRSTPWRKSRVADTPRWSASQWRCCRRKANNWLSSFCRNITLARPSATSCVEGDPPLTMQECAHVAEDCLRGRLKVHINVFAHCC